MELVPEILVTGANGLIGRYVIDKLLANDFKIIALYHTSHPEIEHVNITYIKADLCFEAIDLSNRNVIAVIHCAAILPSPIHNDKMCYLLNKKMDSTVFDFCKKNMATKVIYMSGIYINDYAENELIKISSYLFGKLESERKLLGMENFSIILRISSPYGVYQKTKNVLKIFIENALKNKPILLHGSGERRQDFIFADDIAEAVLLSLNSNKPSAVLNICSGTAVSMHQLASLVQKNKPDVKIEFSGIDDPQENYKAKFDNTATQQFLNWHPKTSLEQGIQIMINYLLK